MTAPVATQERLYPSLTITIADPATGMTTTITGSAEVYLTMWADALEDLGPNLLEALVFTQEQPQRLRLDAKWQRDSDRDCAFYTIERAPTPTPAAGEAA